MQLFPAHIRLDAERNETVQSVQTHCRNVADYAAETLAPMGLSGCGYLAGLIHDSGKMTGLFEDYIHKAASGLSPPRGFVNHTFAGVRYLLQRYHTQELGFKDVVCEFIALAAGSHHGLFDCVNEQGENGFLHRMTKPDICYEEAIDNYLRQCADETEIDRRFNAAQEELIPLLEHIRDGMAADTASDQRYEEETAFYSGLLARMLLSAVIDADRRDTAEFMNGAYFPAIRTPEEIKEVWDACLLRTERHILSLAHSTKIDRARRAISDRCKAAAAMPGGIYRLNVPTGAGKTLSTLRYALAHAVRHGKRRIFYVSPLLSILEQNADVIRSSVQDNSLILEHHSNLVHATDESKEELDTRELLFETWNAPIVITTLVQLLGTMFSGRTSCIRRFHSLCNSVIIIDEVQTVPTNLLSMFTLAINFLTDICGVTVVLCSATQPCVEQLEYPLHASTDIVPYDPALWEAFRRTVIRDEGELSLEETATFAREVLTSADSLLIVCNKKDEATKLFAELRHYGGKVFVLSAAMCMSHRRDALAGVKTSLETRGQKTLCIATQVIEAGVDISFERVIRLAAGMDSVVQAAGRCNRSGENGMLAPVYVIRCKGERLSNLPEIQAGKDASIALFTEFALHPGDYRDALDSDEAIRAYYSTLYHRMPAKHTDTPVKEKPYTLLSLNGRNILMECKSGESYYFRQAFRLAGSLFEVFPENTTDVVVGYKEGQGLIADLHSSRAEHDGSYLKALLEQTKPYTVSLYAYQVRALVKEGALHQTKSGVWTLDGHYDCNSGFVLTQSGPLELLEV